MGWRKDSGINPNFPTIEIPPDELPAEIRKYALAFCAWRLSCRTRLRGRELGFRLDQIEKRYDRSSTVSRLVADVVEERVSLAATRYALEAGIESFVCVLRAREVHKRPSGAPLKPSGVMASAHAFLLELEPRRRLALLTGLLFDLAEVKVSREAMRLVINEHERRQGEKTLIQEIGLVEPSRRKAFAKERLALRRHPFALTAGVTLNRLEQRALVESRVGLVLKLVQDGMTAKGISQRLGVAHCVVSQVLNDLEISAAQSEVALRRRVDRMVARASMRIGEH
jgi:hypothetical protein